MKNKLPLKFAVGLVLFAALGLPMSAVLAQGTAFTYQGQLNNNGSPASGTYNLTFSLYNASSGGSQVGGTITNTGVSITNGLFTVILEFGDPFDGTPYWLQIGVRTKGATLFSALSPRQELTPTPYAITAENVDGLVSASQLIGTLPSVVFSGVYGNPLTLNNPANSFSGNGGGLTNLSAAQLTSIGNATGGSDNFFVGPAGNPTTSGSYNTAEGVQALFYNTTGGGNTANGGFALFYNTSGYYNTAYGYQALVLNTIGFQNTANGVAALGNNTSGYYNTAIGVQALGYNTSGWDNTAIGDQALFYNTTGDGNTAIGYAALELNTNGFQNTANGVDALYNNTSGFENTANGVAALQNNTSGSDNIALGYQAGYHITTGSFNIDIGNQGLSTDTNIIRIGSGQSQAFIAGVINGNGGGLTNLNASQLTSGTVPSAALTSVPAASLTGTIAPAQLPAAVVTNTETGVTLSGAFNGNGSGLTYLNASQLTSVGNTNGPNAFDNFFVGPAGNSMNSGAGNTAIGSYALFMNTSGSDNTANGRGALFLNTSGSDNTANGTSALYNNTSGSDNTANGLAALFSNTSGGKNTADGGWALLNSTSGSNNIALGYYAGANISTGSYNIDIGNEGLSTDTNIIRIGSGQTTTYLAGAIMTSSDQNTKGGFEPVDTKIVLEGVAALPITRWHYTNDVATPHLGPMAQDFRAAFKLGVDDKHIATVDEEGVALAAIQGLNRKLESSVQEKEAEIQDLKQSVDELKKLVQSLSERK